jgi:hypothetical protein
LAKGLWRFLAVLCVLRLVQSMRLMQTKLKKLNADIAKAAKELPRVGRGRESDPVAELAVQIEDLEYTRGTSSMSLADEKDVVRRIAGLKRQQQQFTDFAALKAERDNLVAEQDALATRRQELREGLKTLLLTERIRELNPGVTIGVGDITSSTITVQASVVGRVVGKGGATRQQIEKECGVSVDVQDKSGGVCAIVLNGTASGIAAATSRIEDLSNVEEELVTVEGGLATCCCLVVARVLSNWNPRRGCMLRCLAVMVASS